MLWFLGQTKPEFAAFEANPTNHTAENPRALGQSLARETELPGITFSHLSPRLCQEPCPTPALGAPPCQNLLSDGDASSTPDPKTCSSHTSPHLPRDPKPCSSHTSLPSGFPRVPFLFLEKGIPPVYPCPAPKQQF